MSSITQICAFKLQDGRSLKYSLTFPNEPQRRTVLLSSLLATTYAVWDDVVSVLHQSGFRALSYDHPGHGGSSARADPSANTFEAMADDIYALLHSEAVKRAFSTSQHADGSSAKPMLHAWIGCSLGAATGVVFSTRYPGIVNVLVVCDTISSSPVNAGTEDAFTPRIKLARQTGNLDDALVQSRERWLGKNWLVNHPDKEVWLRDLMSETTLDGYGTCVAALLSPSFDLGKLAPRVASSVDRVVLIVGEKDAPLPSTMKTLTDQISDGFVAGGRDAGLVRFHVLPDAGHASFIDAFDAWCGIVIPFLR